MALIPRSVTIDERQGVTVVRIVATAATINHLNFDEMDQQILDAVGDNPKVLVDMDKVDYFHSSGISFLIRLRKRIVERGGRLQLCCLQPQAHEILKLTGVSRLLTIRTSRKVAMDDFVDASDSTD